MSCAEIRIPFKKIPFREIAEINKLMVSILKFIETDIQHRPPTMETLVRSEIPLNSFCWGKFFLLI